MNTPTTINDPEIVPRFRDLLPPQTAVECEHLEQSILADGIREPIRLWQNKIVDGHHRFGIAQKHDLGYKTVDMYFANEDEVCEWIIQNQIGRRNLEPNLKTLLIGQLHQLQKKRVGRPMEDDTTSAAEQIAKDFNISPRTVERADAVARAYEETSDEELKKRFKEGQATQKELIESIQPAPTPPAKKKKDQWHDDFTAGVRQVALNIDGLLTKVRSQVNDLSQVLTSHGIEMKHFAPELRESDFVFKGYEKELHALKTLIRCPDTSEDCKECQGLEYVTEAQAAGMEKLYEQG